MSAVDITAVARWLQRRGMYVFPIDHPGLPQCAGWHKPGAAPCERDQRGKHPACKWTRDATLDADAIAHHLRRGLRNLGIACGPSGLLVVDEDVPGDLGRYAVGVGAQVPATFTVSTGKGFHYYFATTDPGLGNGEGALREFGVNVRGRGGYVVAPGSVHWTGVEYRPVDAAAPVLPAPDWLTDALRTRPEPPPRTDRPQVARTGRTGGRPYRVLTGIVSRVLNATPNVDRNKLVFWAGCRIYQHADRGLFDENAARAAVLDAARHIGLDDAEANRTLDSAKRTIRGTV